MTVRRGQDNDSFTLLGRIFLESSSSVQIVWRGRLAGVADPSPILAAMAANRHDDHRTDTV